MTNPVHYRLAGGTRVTFAKIGWMTNHRPQYESFGLVTKGDPNWRMSTAALRYRQYILLKISREHWSHFNPVDISDDSDGEPWWRPGSDYTEFYFS